MTVAEYTLPVITTLCHVLLALLGSLWGLQLRARLQDEPALPAPADFTWLYADVWTNLLAAGVAGAAFGVRMRLRGALARWGVPPRRGPGAGALGWALLVGGFCGGLSTLSGWLRSGLHVCFAWKYAPYLTNKNLHLQEPCGWVCAMARQTRAPAGQAWIALASFVGIGTGGMLLVFCVAMCVGAALGTTLARVNQGLAAVYWRRQLRAYARERKRLRGDLEKGPETDRAQTVPLVEKTTPSTPPTGDAHAEQGSDGGVTDDGECGAKAGGVGVVPAVAPRHESEIPGLMPRQNDDEVVPHGTGRHGDAELSPREFVTQDKLDGSLVTPTIKPVRTPKWGDTDVHPALQPPLVLTPKRVPGSIPHTPKSPVSELWSESRSKVLSRASALSESLGAALQELSPKPRTAGMTPEELHGFLSARVPPPDLEPRRTIHTDKTLVVEGRRHLAGEPHVGEATLTQPPLAHTGDPPAQTPSATNSFRSEDRSVYRPLYLDTNKVNQGLVRTNSYRDIFEKAYGGSLEDVNVSGTTPHHGNPGQEAPLQGSENIPIAKNSMQKKVRTPRAAPGGIAGERQVIPEDAMPNRAPDTLNNTTSRIPGEGTATPPRIAVMATTPRFEGTAMTPHDVGKAKGVASHVQNDFDIATDRPPPENSVVTPRPPPDTAVVTPCHPPNTWAITPRAPPDTSVTAPHPPPETSIVIPIPPLENSTVTPIAGDAVSGTAMTPEGKSVLPEVRASSITKRARLSSHAEDSQAGPDFVPVTAPLEAPPLGTQVATAPSRSGTKALTFTHTLDLAEIKVRNAVRAGPYTLGLIGLSSALLLLLSAVLAMVVTWACTHAGEQASQRALWALAGAGARVALAPLNRLPPSAPWPSGTLLANAAGCALMAVASHADAVAELSGDPTRWADALFAGCGAFTTASGVLTDAAGLGFWRGLAYASATLAACFATCVLIILALPV